VHPSSPTAGNLGVRYQEPSLTAAANPSAPDRAHLPGENRHFGAGRDINC
jgi:hypothetical protein